VEDSARACLSLLCRSTDPRIIKVDVEDSCEERLATAEKGTLAPLSRAVDLPGTSGPPFIDINNQLSSESPRYMTKRICSKGRRWISQFVTDQILIDDIPEISNAMLADLSDVVKSSLENPS
jgi:hypothetical protein